MFGVCPAEEHVKRLGERQQKIGFVEQFLRRARQGMGDEVHVLHVGERRVPPSRWGQVDARCRDR